MRLWEYIPQQDGSVALEEAMRDPVESPPLKVFQDSGR